MRRLVAYVAHPVAGDVERHLAQARRWLRWLIDTHPSIAFAIPWLPYVEVSDDTNPAHRIRGVEDDLAMLDRCDQLVLVGGRLSPGMELEVSRARHRGLPVIDYLHLGPLPPGPTELQ